MAAHTRFVVGLGNITLLLLLTGCGGGPKTYPVEGKVLFRNGTVWTGGMVQFTSLADPKIVATGDIGPDGRFTLQTHFVSGTNGKSKPGAIAGEHRVTVDQPNLQTDKNGMPMIRPVVVEKLCSVEKKKNDVLIETK